MIKIKSYIECIDCIEGMKKIYDNSIDLTVTSPPYDDLRSYNSVVDFKEVIKELYRITKDGGVVVWNVNDRIKDGSKSLTSFRQAIMFQEARFNVNDVMIWRKTNPNPSVSQPRYNQCFEYMFVFSKGKPKTFNPIMVECKSAGLEYKSTAKQITKDKDRVYKEFTINDKKVADNIWEIAVAQNKTEHPAVFPEEIPYRHIKTWTNEGDIVLDPFLGSGTTCIVAKEMERKYIGFEIEEKYFKIAKDRLDKRYNLFDLDDE